MTDTSDRLAGRVAALETIIVDVLALAVREVPELRAEIVQRLSAAAEDAAEREAPIEARSIEIIRESFKHST